MVKALGMSDAIFNFVSLVKNDWFENTVIIFESLEIVSFNLQELRTNNQFQTISKVFKVQPLIL